MKIAPVSFSTQNSRNVRFGEISGNLNGQYEKLNINPKISTQNSRNVNFGVIKENAGETCKDLNINPKKKPSSIKTGIVATSLAALAAFGVYSVNKPSYVVTVPHHGNILSLASTYDVGVDAIVDYNHIEKGTLSSYKELKIPSPFDYIQKSIDESKEELHSKLLPESFRYSTSVKIHALRDKQLEQQSTASVYRDDDYVYFKLHLDWRDDKDIEFSGGKATISAENFKQLFDIKDGALKDNNELNFEWASTKYGDITGGYQDYTNAKLVDGETYKVKVSDIETDDINIDKYL